MDCHYNVMIETIGMCIIAIIVCISIGIILYYWKKIIDSNNKSKENMLEFKTSHEKAMKELEWRKKMEWEDRIAKRNEEKNISQIEEKLNKLKEEVEKKQDKPSSLDLNRIAMLHLLLSGHKESLSAENLDEEIKKVEKTYQLLKDKIS